ncbi:glycine C-acetyltransferase [Pokkaliibacter sp. CJK22405]|uniref:glycine C-acetyltransferase n=1 Tax=Pokkaliibacter sp. CJK22405 TaxID=3384615 RepID=UPI00398565C3
MSSTFYDRVQSTLTEIRDAGLYKDERPISSPQSAHIITRNGDEVINLCANNYLGLADHPKLVTAAKQALDIHGFGMASVRFICGTHDLHKTLEQRISQLLCTEDTILYSSCFDANGGLFETLLGPEDAIISDSLNHASIIDGVRLCKAQRYRYQNNDMADLESQLEQAKSSRTILIATDGVFSMDGSIANLQAVCDLAERYGALVMVDDSHAVGFMGENGRGTHEHCGVIDHVDILTGTLGKALGGASGGYISGKKPVIDLLRQRSRPYLFSNSLAPMITAASIAAIDLLTESGDLLKKLKHNSQYFREKMTAAGFNLLPGEHPIVPVMLGDARLAQEMAAMMLDEGIYVTGFSYPVVPQGQARIRTQMSAALSQSDLDTAISAFIKVGKALQIID